MSQQSNLISQYDHILGIPLQQIFQKIEENTGKLDYNLFEPFEFLKTLQKILPTNVYIQENALLTVSQTNNDEQKTIMFIKLWKILTDLTKQLKISIKNIEMPAHSEISDMIINQNCQTLSVYVELLVHIMLRNGDIVTIITNMPEQNQIRIKQFIQTHQQPSELKDKQQYIFNTPSLNHKNSQNYNRDIFDRVQALETALTHRDQLLAKQQQKCHELKQQLNEISQLLKDKNEQIMILKTRISAYSEADVLFQQKDQQIHKLQSELSELQVKSHRKQNQLKTEIEELKTKLKEDEVQKIEVTMQNQKNKNKYQILLIQKQQGDTANKKVIQNLKDKIKNLNDKINQQQKNIMEVLMEKEQKQKQIYQLQKKLQPFEQIHKSREEIPCQEILYRSAKNSSRLDDQLEQFGIDLKTQKQSLKKYYDILFGEEARCSGEMCIAIRSQYVKIVHQILKINNQAQNIDYFSMSNRLECVEDQLKKIQNLLHQNMKLKQKIVLLQNSHQPNKQSHEEINKLKKKLLIMKRKLDEVEAQRKQEIQLLVSAFQQSIKIEINN